MSAMKFPVTPAIRVLRTAGVELEPHLYDYVPDGGAAESATQLGLDLHAVVKTLVLETSDGDGLIVLMHGDREVSTKALARHLGVKSVQMIDVARGRKLTGYEFGGTSPFGTRTELPVYVERTILDHERITINGGKRGFLVTLRTDDLVRVLGAEPVDIAIATSSA